MFLAGSIILIYGFLAIIGTLISDILLVWLDPRIRMEAS
jgi:peptide/nickel transport system permease protein